MGNLVALFVVHLVVTDERALVVLQLVLHGFAELRVPVVRAFLGPYCAESAVIHGHLGREAARRIAGHVRAEQGFAAVVARGYAALHHEYERTRAIIEDFLPDRPRADVEFIQ